MTVEEADVAARGGALGSEPFGVIVRDYYLTNPIARASAVMAEMSALKVAANKAKSGLSAVHLVAGLLGGQTAVRVLNRRAMVDDAVDLSRDRH